ALVGGDRPLPDGAAVRRPLHAPREQRAVEAGPATGDPADAVHLHRVRPAALGAVAGDAARKPVPGAESHSKPVNRRFPGRIGTTLASNRPDQLLAAAPEGDPARDQRLGAALGDSSTVEQRTLTPLI